MSAGSLISAGRSGAANSIKLSDKSLLGYLPKCLELG
jgi:hypothetical protein